MRSYPYRSNVLYASNSDSDKMDETASDSDDNSSPDSGSAPKSRPEKSLYKDRSAFPTEIDRKRKTDTIITKLIKTFGRLLTSLIVLSMSFLACVGYCRMNQFMYNSTAKASSYVLSSRVVKLGRLKRLHFRQLGVSLGQFRTVPRSNPVDAEAAKSFDGSLSNHGKPASAGPSVKRDSSPDVSAQQVDVVFKDVVGFIRKKRSIRVELTLTNAQFHVKQSDYDDFGWNHGLNLEALQSQRLDANPAAPEQLAAEDDIEYEEEMALESNRKQLLYPHQGPASLKPDAARLDDSQEPSEESSTDVIPGIISHIHLKQSKLLLTPAEIMIYSHGGETYAIDKLNGTIRLTDMRRKGQTQQVVNNSDENGNEWDLVTRSALCDHYGIRADVAGFVDSHSITLFAETKFADLLRAEENGSANHVPAGFLVADQAQSVSSYGAGQKSLFRLFLAIDKLPSRAVAATLNLPLRSDCGHISGKLWMSFIPGEKLPVMNGNAIFDDLSLRFSGEETSPLIEHIRGHITFVGSKVLMNHMHGSINKRQIPVELDGLIELLPANAFYDLDVHVPFADVNHILEAFAVKQFAYVRGALKSKMKVHGELEAPKISGLVQQATAEPSAQDATTTAASNQSSAPHLAAPSAVVSSLFPSSSPFTFMLDKVEVSNVSTHFVFDSLERCITFDNIQMKVMEGGSVRGLGGVYFAPEKVLPKKPRKIQPRIKPGVPAMPKDELEIDIYAADRPIDSMMFTFEARNVNGPYLLEKYGGKHGRSSKRAVGALSADIVVAGPVKDGVAKAKFWTSSEAPELIVGTEAVRPPWPFLNSFFSVGKKLGGTFATGTVNLKIGDPPVRRRVRVRGDLSYMDARRVMWENDQVRNLVLANIPQADLNMEFEFSGLLLSEPMLSDEELAKESLTRSPPMKLVGIQGDVLVDNCRFNDIYYVDEMSGPLNMNEEKFSLNLQEKAGDVLQISASESGSASISLVVREKKLSVSVDVEKQLMKLDTKNFNMEDLLGESSGIRGRVDADLTVNASEKRGSGSVSLNKLFMQGYDNIKAFTGEVYWVGNSFLLQKGVLTQKRSEYHIQASYKVANDAVFDKLFPLGMGPKPSPNIKPTAWSNSDAATLSVPHLKASALSVATLAASTSPTVPTTQPPAANVSSSIFADFTNNASLDIKVVVPRGDVRDLLGLLKSPGQAEASGDGQSPDSSESQTGLFGSSAGRDEFLRLLLQKDGNQLLSKEQIQLLYQLSEQSTIRHKAMPLPKLSEVKGHFSGIISLKCKNFGEALELLKPKTPMAAPISANHELLAKLGPLRAVDFEVDVGGYDWAFGVHTLGSSRLKLNLSDGVFRLDPLMLLGPSGFNLQANGTVDIHTGSMDVLLSMKRASLATFARYSNVPYRLRGYVSSDVALKGTFDKPDFSMNVGVYQGRINRKRIRRGSSALVLRNGICEVNMSAEIGRRITDSRRKMERTRNFAQIAPTAAVRVELEKLADDSDCRGEPLRIKAVFPLEVGLSDLIAKSSSHDDESPLFTKLLESSAAPMTLLVDIQKNGNLLLNMLVPGYQFISGESDIFVQAQGTADKPKIHAFYTVSNGVVWPDILPEPMEQVRGQVYIRDRNILDVQLLNARWNGRRVNISGMLPLLDETLEKSFRDKVSRLPFTVDMGELVVHKEQVYYGAISGKIRLTGSAMKPVVSGRLNLSKGILFVANPGISRPLDLELERQAGMPSSISTGLFSSEDFRDAFITSDLQTMRAEDMTVDFAEAGSVDMQITESGFETLVTPLSQQPTPTVAPPGGASEQSSIPPGMTQVGAATSYVISKAPNVGLDGFEVHFQKELRIVYPRVLNCIARGRIEFHGDNQDPRPKGIVYFPSGKVNTLTSQLGFKRGAVNSLTFTGEEVIDPLLDLTLEDPFVVVRAANVRSSGAVHAMEFYDKRGERLGGFSDLVTSFLRQIQTELARARTNISVEAIPDPSQIRKVRAEPEWKKILFKWFETSGVTSRSTSQHPSPPSSSQSSSPSHSPSSSSLASSSTTTPRLGAVDTNSNDLQAPLNPVSAEHESEKLLGSRDAVESIESQEIGPKPWPNVYLRVLPDEQEQFDDTESLFLKEQPGIVIGGSGAGGKENAQAYAQSLLFDLMVITRSVLSNMVGISLRAGTSTATIRLHPVFFSNDEEMLAHGGDFEQASSSLSSNIMDPRALGVGFEIELANVGLGMKTNLYGIPQSASMHWRPSESLKMSFGMTSHSQKTEVQLRVTEFSVRKMVSRFVRSLIGIGDARQHGKWQRRVYRPDVKWRIIGMQDRKEEIGGRDSLAPSGEEMKQEQNVEEPSVSQDAAPEPQEDSETGSASTNTKNENKQ